MTDKFDYLLFPTKEAYQANLAVDEDSVTNQNLNLDSIVDALLAKNPEFPFEQLMYVNQDPQTAIYRHNIFRELNSDEAIEAIGVIFGKIYAIDSINSNIQNLSDEEQAYIARIFLIDRALGVFRQITDFLSSFNSDGLKVAYAIFREYLSMPDVRDASMQISATVALLEEKLNFYLNIDTAKKTVKLSRKTTATDNLSDRVDDNIVEIDRICRELFDVAFIRPFPAADDSIMSALERTVLRFIISSDIELKSCLEALRLIEIDWEILFSFRRQMSFFHTYLRLMRDVESKQLHFCIPTLCDSVRIAGDDIFDLSLAVSKLHGDDLNVTVNSISLPIEKNGAILTGANQGGKTTFLRSVGLSCLLAMCGCPVPATCFSIAPLSKIITFFSASEDECGRISKFEAEAKAYFTRSKCFSESVLVLFNEYFVGTNRQQGAEILKQCIVDIINRGASFICVTHMQELYNMLGDKTNESVKYLKSEIKLKYENCRTYRIIEQRPDGCAYSRDIAIRYGLTYEQLMTCFDTDMEVSHEI